MADPTEAAPTATTTVADHISVTATAEYDRYPHSSEQACWAIASFKAPFYEPTSRAPVDIVAVIDKSGSMRGTKLDLVKKTLLFVVDQLKDCDRMSLVTYDTYVQLVFKLTRMDTSNKDRLKTFIQSIVDGSSTNLSGGLLKGMEQVARTEAQEEGEKTPKVQSVLLLTDGLANHGITTREGILAEMKKMQDLGLGAVQLPQSQPSYPPRGHRGGLHNLMRPMPQRQQRRVGPPLLNPFGQPQQQVGQAPFLPQQQQQQQMPELLLNVAPLAPPPLPVQQQQVVPPPPAQQQQVVPPPPPQQQQVVPPPPPQQQQVAPPPPPPPAQQQQVAPPPPPPPPPAQQQQVVPPPPPPPVQQQQAALFDLQLDPQQPAAVDDGPIPPNAKFNGTVYTFGFGSDHDSNLLEAISTQGGGVYYYIDTNEKIPESFADCLGGLLSVVGQNLSFKLEALGENTMTAVHANRAINWTTANKSCEIPMGDLQSEEERDIVLELKLPALPAPKVDKVIKATLSYFNIITSELDTVTHELTIKREDGDPGSAREPVDIQRNRILATNALKEAEPLADRGRLDEAKKTLQDAVTTIELSLTGKQEFCQSLISDLKRTLATMTSRQSYLGHGKLYMHSKMQTHSVQRSNFVDDSSYYQNRQKKAFRSLAKK